MAFAERHDAPRSLSPTLLPPFSFFVSPSIALSSSLIAVQMRTPSSERLYKECERERPHDRKNRQTSLRTTPLGRSVVRYFSLVSMLPRLRSSFFLPLLPRPFRDADRRLPDREPDRITWFSGRSDRYVRKHLRRYRIGDQRKDLWYLTIV